eukprot:SAG31_NODE_3358_length_4367_cov_1.988051_2_plen_180_part_00
MYAAILVQQLLKFSTTAVIKILAVFQVRVLTTVPVCHYVFFKKNVYRRWFDQRPGRRIDHRAEVLNLVCAVSISPRCCVAQFTQNQAITLSQNADRISLLLTTSAGSPSIGSQAQLVSAARRDCYHCRPRRAPWQRKGHHLDLTSHGTSHSAVELSWHSSFDRNCNGRSRRHFRVSILQ